MSIEPRNEPQMLRWFRKTYPSYDLQPLLLKRLQRLAWRAQAGPRGAAAPGRCEPADGGRAPSGTSAALRARRAQGRRTRSGRSCRAVTHKEMKTLRSHGFNQRPRFEQVAGYLERNEPLPLDQPDRKATTFVTSHFYLDDFVQSSEDRNPAGLAVGLAGGAAYGLARGTGWVLENTLFRPQQGSEDAAVQDVRSANGMNDATQPQHFTLRTGSSTSGSPASSRASSQSGFRVQAQTNHTPRPFSWGLNPVTLPQSQPNSRASSRSRARAACLRRATTSWPETSRRPRLSFTVRTKMSVALHVKKHGGSHSRSTG